MRLRVLASAVSLLLLASAANAHEFKSGNLLIEHPWVRATVPSAKVGGGYLTIVNNGTEADRLTGVSSELGSKTEIHEMAMKDGVMSMRAVEGGIDIPAGATVALQPAGGHDNGYHVMFMGLDRQLKEGETFKGALTFEKAGEIAVEFKVEPIGYKHDGGTAQGAEDHSGHSGHGG